MPLAVVAGEPLAVVVGVALCVTVATGAEVVTVVAFVPAPHPVSSKTPHIQTRTDLSALIAHSLLMSSDTAEHTAPRVFAEGRV